MYLTSDISETGSQPPWLPGLSDTSCHFSRKQLNIMFITRRMKTHDVQNLHFKSSCMFSADSWSAVCEMMPSSGHTVGNRLYVLLRCLNVQR